MLSKPFYDPAKSYEENLLEGPYGAFADGTIYQETTTPQQNFLGQKVFLPFGIPAGPLLNGKFCRAALDKGFDIVTYKTVRSKKHAVHPWPNVIPVEAGNHLTLEQAEQGLRAKETFSEPIAITNSFGVPSSDPDVWQPDFAATVQYAKEGQVVVGSFQGTNPGNVQGFIDDYATTAKLLVEAGASVLEANLSCPNEGTSNLLCFDAERVAHIVDAIKNTAPDIPLLLKIAYFREQNLFSKFMKTVGPLVEGLSMINTIGAPVRTSKGDPALPGEGRLRSGICGVPIKWAGLEMVTRAKELREENNLSLTIVGVGGVTQPSDYFEYTKAGADAVQSATGAMWNPYLAQEIKKQI